MLKYLSKDNSWPALEKIIRNNVSFNKAVPLWKTKGFLLAKEARHIKVSKQDTWVINPRVRVTEEIKPV